MIARGISTWGGIDSQYFYKKGLIPAFSVFYSPFIKLLPCRFLNVMHGIVITLYMEVSAVY